MRGKYIRESDYFGCIYGRDYEINGEDRDFSNCYGVMNEIAQYYGWGYLYDKEDFKIIDDSPCRDLEDQHKIVRSLAEAEGYDGVRFLRKWRNQDVYQLIKEEYPYPETFREPVLAAFQDGGIRYLTEEEHFAYIAQYREYFIDPVEAFYYMAKDYCEYIEGGVIETYDIPELIHKLMELYAAALMCPCRTNKKTDTKMADLPLPEIRFSFRSEYWQIKKPFRKSDPEKRQVKEDLLAVYHDLKIGTLEYEADRIMDAADIWKYEFVHHWGQIVVDVMRALHKVWKGGIT